MKTHIDAISQELFTPQSAEHKEFLYFLLEAALLKDNAKALTEIIGIMEHNKVAPSHVEKRVVSFLRATQGKNFTHIDILLPYLKKQDSRELSEFYENTANPKAKAKAYEILLDRSTRLADLVIFDKAIEHIKAYQHKILSAPEFKAKMKEFMQNPKRLELLKPIPSKEAPSYSNQWGKTAEKLSDYNVVEKNLIRAKIKEFEAQRKNLFSDFQAVLDIGDFQKNSPLLALEDSATLTPQIVFERENEATIQTLLSHPSNEKKHFNILLNKLLGGDKLFSSLSPYDNSGQKNKNKHEFFVAKLQEILINKPDLYPKYALAFHCAGLESLFKITQTTRPKDIELDMLGALRHITLAAKPSTKKSKLLYLSVSVELEKRILENSITAPNIQPAKPSFKI